MSCCIIHAYAERAVHVTFEHKMCTCNVTDKLLVTVTPKILIAFTHWGVGISSETGYFVFHPGQ